ncbi:MAG: DUF4350 domain-containing protein [Bacteroidota bacterium]
MKEAFFFLWVLQILCVLPGTAAQPRVALFDRAHGELFGPTGSHPLDCSTFASLFKEEGYVIKTQDRAITPDALRGVSVLIISGAFKDLAVSEVDVIERYVRGGGNVIVLLHVSSPVARLTERFGIIVSNATVYETDKEAQIDEKPYNFFVSRFHSHPIVSGVKRMAVYGSWALMCEGKNARLLAMTSPKAYADITGNKKLDPEDPIQAFGIVASSETDAGKVLVVADDTVLSNGFITEVDNIRLARNIVRWLTPAKKAGAK